MRCVCRVPKENSNEYFRLIVEWNVTNLIIRIVDNSFAWQGRISEADIHNSSKQFSLSSEEYINEVKQALTTDGGDTHFTYSIEGSSFVWKKIDPDSNMKFKFGTVDLENVALHSVFENMIDLVLDNNRELNIKVKDLEERTQKLLTERNNLKESCQVFCVEKSSLEKSLYSSFASVLNTKKEKIETLEEELTKILAKTDQNNGTAMEEDPSKEDSDTQKCKSKGRKKTSVTTDDKPAVRKGKKPVANTKREVVIQPILPVENNHYDSDTDVDENTTDDENDTLFDLVPASPPRASVTTKASERGYDPFEEDGPTTSVILPKRIRIESEQNKKLVNEGVKKSNKQPSTSKRPLKLDSQPVLSQFDTQELFDDL